MRLFVAVDVNDETRAQLSAARESISALIGNARVPPRIAWVNPAVAHVTLRFIGETSETVARAIQDALGAAPLCAPFHVTWETVGTFGGPRHPRVIWVAPTTGAEALTELAERVDQRLDPVIGRSEERPFKPHLTIARVRDAGRNVAWSAALAAVHFTPAVTTIDHVTLYQSRLSPKGPTYTALSTHG